MRPYTLVFFVTVPWILACGNLPGFGGSTTPPEPTEPPPTPTPTGPDAIDQLGTALDHLGAAVDTVEKADPATLDGARLSGARDRMRGALAALQPVVQRLSGGAPAAPATADAPAAPADAPAPQ